MNQVFQLFTQLVDLTAVSVFIIAFTLICLLVCYRQFADLPRDLTKPEKFMVVMVNGTIVSMYLQERRNAHMWRNAWYDIYTANADGSDLKLLFGGEVIRSFTISMLFGVLVGTYSSIFVEAPVLSMLGLKTRADVKELRASNLSMMPEGLLAGAWATPIRVAPVCPWEGCALGLRRTGGNAGPTFSSRRRRRHR